MAKPAFRRAASNLGWLLAERAVRFVLGVGVGFVVARYLGPVRLGTLSYCTAIVGLVAGFAAFGVDQIVRRDLLSQPDGHDALLAGAVWLRLCCGALGYGVVLAAAALGAARTAEEQRLIALLGCTLFQPALLVPDLWLQAKLQARFSVIAQTAALAVGAALRIWLVLAHAGLRAFAAVGVLEAMLGAAGIWALARRAGMDLRWGAARWATIRRLAMEAWPLTFASLAIVVYMEIDEVMLRQLAGPAAVGIYAAATRLTEIWYFVPTAMASSVLPALLRARERGAKEYLERLQRYCDLSAGIAYAVAIPLALAAPWVVRAAYGSPFESSAPIVAVHVWSSVFVFLGVVRGQWLVNERHPHFYLAATLAGAALNIGLNLWFIPHWGGIGAASATVISQASAAWLSSFCSAATREMAWIQTRAVLLPVLGWRYLRRDRAPAAV